ncbi:unnamed protein product [Polarella glacialis]|uniref:Prolyl 4-hydroxylase alpha subunit domain-containing protein n=1 Tax=Polarella glacialis TaxID=89957 RepID=A0A813EK16_POLGL|nr:unnamed protein product [Polarella glacialis]CAE8615315.1 unnamed protein product [Polarella glacialis]CAE8693844.1 unnamed protein product [Polarella glacialis]
MTLDILANLAYFCRGHTCGTSFLICLIPKRSIYDLRFFPPALMGIQVIYPFRQTHWFTWIEKPPPTRPARLGGKCHGLSLTSRQRGQLASDMGLTQGRTGELPRSDASVMASSQPRKEELSGSSAHMCECIVTHNFFVRSVGMHFEYDGDDAEFRHRYAGQLVDGDGDALSSLVVAGILAEVRQQRAERLQAPEESLARVQRIEESYRRLHPEVYTIDPKAFLAESFLELVEVLRGCQTSLRGVSSSLEDLKSRGLLQEKRPGLWTFKVFTEAFCDLLETELANFAASGLPCTAPNTMNQHGVILAELGFYPGLLNPLVYEYVDVLAGQLLPDHTEGLDSYRAFTVLYDAAADGDRDLALHYDNAEVTLNVNIGGSWAGGQVAFYGLATEEESDTPAEISLQRGHGVLHAGLDMHKALPITSGRRHNPVIWCRSSRVRNQLCPMCFRQPCVLPTCKYFDEGFTVPPCRLACEKHSETGCKPDSCHSDEDLYG